MLTLTCIDIRLLLNDNEGYIGMINNDGTSEKKYDVASTGEQRHAVTVYKVKFSIFN